MPASGQLIRAIRAVTHEFLLDESGQDAVEYVLLAATIGLGSIAVMNILRSTMGDSYSSWLTASDSLWEPPAPSGS